MNAPSPQPPRPPSAPAESAHRETDAGDSEESASPEPSRNSLQPARETRNPQSAGPGARGPSGGGEKSQPIRDLLEACLRMLKLTGGSHYWTGDTQAALEFMEAAVAAALESGALRAPQPGAPAIVPEIVASAASSVDCALQMAGIEAESCRAV